MSGRWTAGVAGSVVAATTIGVLGGTGSIAWAAPAPPVINDRTGGSPSSSQPPARKVQVIAHRGGEVGTPESTLAAFGNSIAKGVDGIVFDIRFTGDHVPMVLHDATLDRTTNCHGALTHITARSLRHCNAADNFPQIGFQHVPTLDETLRFITSRSSTTTLYLHAKTVRNSREAQAIVLAMHKYHLANSGPPAVPVGP
jgi:glycerophosphoryl diester phosphodiesterase